MIHVEPERGLHGKSQEFAFISPLLTCDLWDVTLSVSFSCKKINIWMKNSCLNVTGLGLSSLQLESHSILKAALGGKHCYYPDFTNEKTKVQRH